ncbi:hypothetical protein [Granulicella aggregans]|uniref:hypothetical protein n=1 Tax=Granulicella aggregans TaxID=474949 RepID=UPI0021E0E0B0|nr:hypothetical protein [Granulicella aggregans]
MPTIRAFALILFASTLTVTAQSEDKPVRVVADRAVPVTLAGGSALLPVNMTLDGRNIDLSHVQPSVTRVIILFHGLKRNVETTNTAGLDAIADAGPERQTTLLIVPQFLEQVDIDAHHLPGNILRWAPEAWMNGADAINAPVSTFTAIDSLLALVANRAVFPNLKTVIVAGHSAGGQLTQRYAVATHGNDSLTRNGVHLRFVIANRSSLVYFSPERPVLSNLSEFTFAIPSATCSGKYNHWKYGLVDPPPYLASEDLSQLESHYIARDIIYLLGTADNDPNHPELDKSCPGELEGPYRFYRGKAYFRYLQGRHHDLTQQLWTVPGVAHDSAKMFGSVCGLAALFDSGSCPTSLPDPKP